MISKHFEYLERGLKILQHILVGHLLCFFPLFVLFLAVLRLKRVICMLFDLCLDDFLLMRLALLSNWHLGIIEPKHGRRTFSSLQSLRQSGVGPIRRR